MDLVHLARIKIFTSPELSTLEPHFPQQSAHTLTLPFKSAVLVVLSYSVKLRFMLSK